jgi:PHD/YefM family antitoxin component YafN of YafNO toxin-antitoxin module
MSQQITANDLKTKGVTAIEAALHNHTEAIVSVRGYPRFVVMELDYYNHLRECELETALAESRADIEAGRFVDESAEAHVAGLFASDKKSTKVKK